MLQIVHHHPNAYIQNTYLAPEITPNSTISSLVDAEVKLDGGSAQRHRELVLVLGGFEACWSPFFAGRHRMLSGNDLFFGGVARSTDVGEDELSEHIKPTTTLGCRSGKAGRAPTPASTST